MSALSFFGFLRMVTSFPENVVARIGGLNLAELWVVLAEVPWRGGSRSLSEAMAGGREESENGELEKHAPPFGSLQPQPICLITYLDHC